MPDQYNTDYFEKIENQKRTQKDESELFSVSKEGIPGGLDTLEDIESFVKRLEEEVAELKRGDGNAREAADRTQSNVVASIPPYSDPSAPEMGKEGQLQQTEESLSFREPPVKAIGGEPSRFDGLSFERRKTTKPVSIPKGRDGELSAIEKNDVGEAVQIDGGQESDRENNRLDAPQPFDLWKNVFDGDTAKKSQTQSTRTGLENAPSRKSFDFDPNTPFVPSRSATPPLKKVTEEKAEEEAPLKTAGEFVASLEFSPPPPQSQPEQKTAELSLQNPKEDWDLRQESASDITIPDFVSFDADSSSGMPFEEVQDAAAEVWCEQIEPEQEDGVFTGETAGLQPEERVVSPWYPTDVYTSDAGGYHLQTSDDVKRESFDRDADALVSGSVSLEQDVLPKPDMRMSDLLGSTEELCPQKEPTEPLNGISEEAASTVAAEAPLYHMPWPADGDFSVWDIGEITGQQDDEDVISVSSAPFFDGFYFSEDEVRSEQSSKEEKYQEVEAAEIRQERMDSDGFSREDIWKEPLENEGVTDEARVSFVDNFSPESSAMGDFSPFGRIAAAPDAVPSERESGAVADAAMQEGKNGVPYAAVWKASDDDVTIGFTDVGAGQGDIEIFPESDGRESGEPLSSEDTPVLSPFEMIGSIRERIPEETAVSDDVSDFDGEFSEKTVKQDEPPILGGDTPELLQQTESPVSDDEDDGRIYSLFGELVTPAVGEAISEIEEEDDVDGIAEMFGSLNLARPSIEASDISAMIEKLSSGTESAAELPMQTQITLPDESSVEETGALEGEAKTKGEMSHLLSDIAPLGSVKEELRKKQEEEYSFEGMSGHLEAGMIVSEMQAKYFENNLFPYGEEGYLTFHDVTSIYNMKFQNDTSRPLYNNLDITIPKGSCTAFVSETPLDVHALLRATKNRAGIKQGYITVGNRRSDDSPNLLYIENDNMVTFGMSSLQFLLLCLSEVKDRPAAKQEKLLNVLEDVGLSQIALIDTKLLTKFQRIALLLLTVAMSNLIDGIVLNPNKLPLDMADEFVIRKIFELLHNAGKTVLLVGNNLVLTACVANRIVAISEGIVVFDGGFSEFVERYCDSVFSFSTKDTEFVMTLREDFPLAKYEKRGDRVVVRYGGKDTDYLAALIARVLDAGIAGRTIATKRKSFDLAVGRMVEA